MPGGASPGAGDGIPVPELPFAEFAESRGAQLTHARTTAAKNELRNVVPTTKSEPSFMGAFVRNLVCAAILILPLLTACSKDNTGPGGGDGGSFFRARIDGVPWSSLPFAMGGSADDGGIFTVVGSNATGTGLSLVLYHIGAPGTYKLGVGGSVPGGAGTLTVSPSSWWTALTGNSGEVTVTTVTPTRIVGTFHFDAKPFSGGAAGNKTIDQGEFDITFPTPGSITLHPGAGSTFGGTMNNAPWNAATVVTVSHPSQGILTVGASNDVHNINLTVSGFTGVGTYALGSGVARYMGVTLLGFSQSWGGTQTTATGTITISS
jgi:hypothetical protein